MKHVFSEQEGCLIWQYDSETLRIEPWGENSLRLRAWCQAKCPEENWALTEPVPSGLGHIGYEKRRGHTVAVIENGEITAKVTEGGKVTFFNEKGQVLLEEYVRYRKDVREFCSALNLCGREFQPIMGGDYGLTVRFESDPHEKIFGMGQYQQPFFNVKGCTLELAHRNSQASVPFYVSNLGYGFLWNNPAIGRVTFGLNMTEWTAAATRGVDYWITAGDTPAMVEEQYANVTGKVPMMPEYGLGFWQCKLRYRTQEEVLSVAREYKRRGLPIDVIVIDFFHWRKQGDWSFDERFFPNPKAMVDELHSMGIELMVSIWPTVDVTCDNFEEMMQKGYLVRCDHGLRHTMDFMGDTVFYDATHPGSRDFVWRQAKKNYYDLGIRIFWLDEAEPEYSVYDYPNYRYHLGPDLQVGNLYPVMYAKTFYDGMEQEGQKQIVNLVRCAWAGSQKYGALVWSGDIDSSFRAMQTQLRIGLSMGMAGIPWWTMDCGGFHGGNPESEEFRELLIRWFQWSCFCPVMRLHGDRLNPGSHQGALPITAIPEDGLLPSGGPNEVWSYGEACGEILERYMHLREKLRPITREAMRQAHEKGTPVMRPLFYEFPDDPQAWDVDDTYMFGGRLLVAPILELGARTRKLYLPKGAVWQSLYTGERIPGGQWIETEAPLEEIPVFLRDPEKMHL